MPTVLSTIKDRVYGRTWSFPYNCYEVGHGWTPYCTEAAFDVGAAAFKNTVPLYTSLYLFTQLGVQRKYNPEAFYETFKSILTSSSFLAFNLYAGMCVSCTLRNNSDRYYYRIQCFLPGFIASYVSLLIERPSRRPALAFYLANMSTEVLYKSMADKGYIFSLPHGETFLFALGMACWLRFVRIYGFGHDPVSTAMKYLIGPGEAKSRAKKATQQLSNEETIKQIEYGSADAAGVDNNINKIIEKRKSPQAPAGKLAAISENITSILNLFFGAHELCPHKGISCVDYAITPSISRFAIAYLARSMLNLGVNIRLLRAEPLKAFKNAFSAKSSINAGLFLGSFVLATKSVHCILRRLYGRQETWHSALAGFISGFSMLYMPKSTLSTYVIWKCLEQYFFLGVKNNYIKNPEVAICLVYAFSVNILLYIFAVEPRFVRPSYMKFIDKISDHRLHQVNRMVLDIFSNEASIGYEDWFPNLDPKYMSREFHELVFNWLIQPY